LNENIEPRELLENWMGWWGKATIFSPKHGFEEGLNFFIDLDMIISGSLDDLFKFNGKFALLRTDEIQNECLNKGGYNSSIMYWRGNEFKEIYELLKRAHAEVSNVLFRFDYWLEMVILNSEFIQEKFPGEVKDYLAECKESVPKGTKIIAFPRDPKPHEHPSEWIKDLWI